MKIDIDLLTYEELIDLNHRVVERLKFLDHLLAHQEMLRLRIGQRVTFTPTGRQPITGIVAKYNRKTVTIVTEDGQRWRVAPEFVSPADEKATHTGNVFQIRNDESSK